jgi:hypothetical protein
VTQPPVTQAVEIEEPDLPESPDESVPSDSGPIVTVRSSMNAWWCPNDDTSMAHSLTECPVCGFLKP